MSYRTSARRAAAPASIAALALFGALLPATSATAGPTPTAPATVEPLRYRIAEVITGGTLGTVASFRMNAHADVVGAANYPLDAFRWSDGEFEVLPDLPGFERHAGHDITDNGTVVGGADGSEVSYGRAVRWVDGGEPEVLGTLEPSGSSGAYAANESGMVVGVASVGFVQHAFAWTEDEGMIDITGSYGSAVDVNESGQVTGERGSKAYVWENGAIRMLELASGFPFSHGNRINDLGQVAGNVFTSGGVRAERLARWTPDGQVEILGGGGSRNQSLGINNHGTVVGYGIVDAGVAKGVIYTDGIGLRSIDSLMTTNEMEVFSGNSINDAGQILASGRNTFTGEGMTVILDPVSGPFMHEEDFRVDLRNGGAKAVAKLQVVDEDGDPVRRARVVAAWYDGDRLVKHGVTDRTDARGRAQLVRSTRGTGGLMLCLTEITHPKFTYDPADGGRPPCRPPGVIG